jgi:glycosyltransferase involved in cell wall biosynthesis
MKKYDFEKKEIIFFGSLFPEQIIDDLRELSVGPIGNANDLFQKNLIKGILNNKAKMSVFNFPNVGSFPIRYKKIIVPSCKSSGISSFGFPNISVVKQIYQILFLIFYALKNYDKIRKTDLLIAYDLNLVFLLAVPLLKVVNPLLKVCFIVPDLPTFTGDGSRNKIKGRVTNLIFRKIEKKIDYFSLITSSMASKLLINKQKCIVIEGVYDPSLETVNNVSADVENKVITYSGAIDKRNGVANLLNAFCEMRSKNKELHIYGGGELGSYVKDFAKSRSDIFYFGQVSAKEVLESYKNTSLLVNPRLPVDEFTMYSFPSKTMEYLASGVPVVMYRLPGVPPEYFDYVTVPNDYCVKSLADAMDLAILSEGQYSVAKDSRDFILSQKNCSKQAYRLLSFISK